MSWPDPGAPPVITWLWLPGASPAELDAARERLRSLLAASAPAPLVPLRILPPPASR